MYSIVAMDELGKNHFTLEETMTLETLRINGDNVITFDIEYTDINKEFFSKVDKRWKIKVIRDKSEKVYVVQNIYEKTFGNSMYMSIDTLYEPHDKLKREMVYKEHNGSKTRDEWFRWLFEDSSFKVEVNAPPQYATSIESFGYDSRLSLFLQLLDKYQLEYYFTGAKNDIIAVRQKIGEDKSDYISYGVNLIELARSRQMGSFGTIGKMFGAYYDDEHPERGRHTVTYRSPLADHYGEIPIKPLVDERFKIKENMETEIKNAINNSIITSIEVDFDELTFEQDGGWVSIGDSIVLIDERLNLSILIRVVQIDTTYDAFGDIVNINYTLGNFDEYYITQTAQLTYPKEVDSKLKDVKGGTSQAIKDAKDEMDKNITDKTDKIKDDLNKFGDDLHIIREKLEIATDMANGAGRIYRQKLPPIGDNLNHGDLWYKPTWNSVTQRDDVRMYQYQKEGNIGKWVEVIDVELGNASNLNRGQINARTINLINLNADEIVTGTIRGKNLQIDLDRGLVEFQRGRIYKDDDSFSINVDDGSIHSKNPTTGHWFNLRRGKISLSERLGIGAELSELGHIAQSLMFENGLGLEIQGKKGVAMGIDGFRSPTFLRDCKGAGFHASTIAPSQSGSIERAYTEFASEGTINLITGKVSSKPQISIDKESGILITTYDSPKTQGISISQSTGRESTTPIPTVSINAGVGSGVIGSSINGHLKLMSNDRTTMTGKTLDIHPRTIFYGDMNVQGKKNAIHMTRDGIRETPAYETATSYIGDIGEVTTNEHGMAIVEIPDIFYDIANFDEDYQVFLTPYDFCQFKVGTRNSKYFTIETDKGNCKIGYEVKAKRRGYESEWFNKQDMSYEDFNNMMHPEEKIAKLELDSYNKHKVMEGKMDEHD